MRFAPIYASLFATQRHLFEVWATVAGMTETLETLRRNWRKRSFQLDENLAAKQCIIWKYGKLCIFKKRSLPTQVFSDHKMDRYEFVNEVLHSKVITHLHIRHNQKKLQGLNFQITVLITTHLWYESRNFNNFLLGLWGRHRTIFSLPSFL